MWLTVRSGQDAGKSIEIEGDGLVVGRGEDCDLTLSDGRVSRRHAHLRRDGEGRVTVKDLDSGNGTYVNGERIAEAELAGGEQLQIGDTILASSSESPAPAGSSTILGAVPRTVSQSGVYRLVVQRSVRRATILSGTAIVLASLVAVLFATGVLPPGDGEGGSQAVQGVVSGAAPSTVLVEALQGERRAGSGTGWVLDAANGLVVTNAHVVDGGSTFRIGVKGKARDATIVGLAPCEDLAVLEVADRSGLRTMPLGDQGSLELGETVVAIGYPQAASAGASLTSTTGVVSVARTTYREAALDIPRYPNVVQTDAAINPGNSGGPLLDLDGRLIGVNSAGRTLSPEGRIVQGQNYAIGVDRVKEVTAALRAGRSLAWTGLSFDYPSPEDLRRRELPPGLLIDQAVEGTAAASQNLQTGELIVAVNDRAIDNSLASYCEAVGSDAPTGTATTLAVLAPGASTARDVRLELE